MAKFDSDIATPADIRDEYFNFKTFGGPSGTQNKFGK